MSGSCRLLCKPGALTSSDGPVFLINVQFVIILEQEEFRSLNSRITNLESYEDIIKLRILWPH